MTQHKSAVHEGVKYTCRQCDYQATTEGCLLCTKWQYISELNVLASIETIKQLRMEILTCYKACKEYSTYDICDYKWGKVSMI